MQVLFLVLSRNVRCVGGPPATGKGRMLLRFLFPRKSTILQF
jgi:hypothetical protein